MSYTTGCCFLIEKVTNKDVVLKYVLILFYIIYEK